MEDRTANWLSATAATGVLLLSFGFAALILDSAKTTARVAEVTPGNAGPLKLERRSGNVRLRVTIDATGMVEVRGWEDTRALPASTLQLVGVVLEERRLGCGGNCLLAKTSALQGTPVRLTVRAAIAGRATIAETFVVPAVLPTRRGAAPLNGGASPGRPSEQGA